MWALHSLLERPLQTLSNSTSFILFDPVLTELLLLYIKDVLFMPTVLIVLASQHSHYIELMILNPMIYNMSIFSTILTKLQANLYLDH